MNSLTSSELWQALQKQNLVTGEMPATNASTSPWFVHVMLGVAGWIAAFFLLGFIGAGFAHAFDHAETSLVLGLLGCAAAYGIFRSTEHSDFWQQFGMAVSIAAQALFTVGLFNAIKSDTTLSYFLLFVFELLLTLLLPNFIHRVLTSWAAMLALMLALSSAGIYGFASGIAAAGFALIWTNQWRWTAHGKLWRPTGYGLCLALLQCQAWNFIDLRPLLSNATLEPNWFMFHAATISTTLITLTLLLVVRHLLVLEQFSQENPISKIAVGVALLLGGLSFVTPGVATAILILLLGFSSGNRILMGLGLLALGVFVSHYYYQLQNTLLFKSLVLAITGSTLLIIRLGLQTYFPLTHANESNHA